MADNKPEMEKCTHPLEEAPEEIDEKLMKGIVKWSTKQILIQFDLMRFKGVTLATLAKPHGESFVN